MKKVFRQESNKIHLYKKNIPQSGGWIRRKQTGGVAGAALVRKDEGLSGLGQGQGGSRRQTSRTPAGGMNRTR